jgi:PPOX class probable F420-dependent enzyme
MMTKLDPAIHELASGPNYGVLATLMPDGRPQTSVVWVDSDGEHLLVNTEVHRQKFQNVSRDDRVSVVVWDHEKPDREGEVRGRVVDRLTGSDAREHIDRLSQKYAGTPYAVPIKSERVILRIEPVHQVPPPVVRHN